MRINENAIQSIIKMDEQKKTEKEKPLTYTSNQIERDLWSLERMFFFLLPDSYSYNIKHTHIQTLDGFDYDDDDCWKNEWIEKKIKCPERERKYGIQTEI